MAEEKQLLALAALEHYLETKSEKALLKFWELYPKPIPSWHVLMMNDESRNDFYLQEIKHQVPGKIVLDVGCGAGLLTRYALENQAAHVYAVEQDPVLQTCFAHAFKNEIKAGKVTLFSKNSKDVKLADFTSGHPQIVIHEIFGKSLLNEEVLETFHDLFQRKLINQETEFIPQKFKLMCCLNYQPNEAKINDPAYAEQFWFMEDISYFNKSLTSDPHNPGTDVSEGFCLFDIDLKKLEPHLNSEIKTEASHEGNSLRVWFELEGMRSKLSTDVRINRDNHWGNTTYYLRFPKGQVDLKATYGNGKFLVYALQK